MEEDPNSCNNEHPTIDFNHEQVQPQIDSTTQLSPSSTLQSHSTSQIRLSNESMNQMMLEYLREKGYEQEPTMIRLNNNRPDTDS
ncbi:unnamed protein product [Debaryomyces tyrocola]|nr:unnamed protein product [Debaryomyces tyrocola]